MTRDKHLPGKETGGVTPADCHRRRGQGFTLTELLVVISIIAILASFLMPTLSKSMSYARSINCANNLKQQATAMFLYADDNRSILAPQIGAAPAYTPYWNKRLVDGGYINQRVFYCPDMPASTFSWYTAPHYGVNANLYTGVGGVQVVRNLASASKPSSKLFIMDSYQSNSDNTSNLARGYFRVIFMTISAPTNVNFGRPAGRHNLVCNVVWLDGHLKGHVVMNVDNPYLAVPFNYNNADCKKTNIEW